ncbi:ring-cleaving dioxygenase [Roseinatronobacter monicus]|uniref:Glyoxalase family protein n=1 Tax=Roseinatronobacter monicus TaxID=393481 RepID=A0A543KG45_9RHOB|nr:ring-cleaving dioxygenase [Roseinatronobacter monicus]TQM94056.1 glyoxalase family protein [Roseinatronobacter monicus]
MTTAYAPIAGLHHVTAISGPAQENLDFYTRMIKTRLVKQTVNFDAPEMYHLYYGAQNATPGSVLTFFNSETRARGQAGVGATQAFAYAIAPDDLAQWHDTLGGTRTSRFGAEVLSLTDPHGQAFEMVADPDAGTWGEFHSVTLWVADPEPTARILTEVFGYSLAGEERGTDGTRTRYTLPGDAPGRVVDLWRADAPVKARPGPGTIHHVAFRARDAAHQQALREVLLARGETVTEVKDRQYFKAIYFREPAGILFEIATDGPGFDIDEPMATLGQSLKLPPQHEARRAELESRLPPLDLHHA